MPDASSGPSSNENKIRDRIRAWFLIKVDKSESEVKKFAMNLQDTWGNPRSLPNSYKKLLEEKGTKYEKENLVVIRSDVVILRNNNPCDINLIVPVDALSSTELDALKESLENDSDIKVLVAEVDNHFPRAPYVSQGFISKEEAILGISEDKPIAETVGLTRNSPGDNPWG